MKTRKWLAFLLTVLLAATLLLPGCGKQPKDSAPQATEAPVVTEAPKETEAPVVVDEGPDDVPIALVPAGDVIDKYQRPRLLSGVERLGMGYDQRRQRRGVRVHGV